MDVDLLNNKIVIVKDGTKKSLLSLISKSKKLVNTKIITLSELKKKYYFDYDKNTIFFICKNYNVNYEVALMYISNLYYIKDIDNEKISFLNELKNNLDKNKLLEYNKLFHEYLKSKDIILYDLKYVDKFYLNIFNELEKDNNIIRVDDYVDNGKKDLYCFKDIEEEVSFVASKICDLIKSNVDINNIKLCNVNSGNYNIVSKIFKMFNIPVELNFNSSVIGSKIIKLFKDNYCSDISKTIEIISSLIETDEDKEIYKSIIDIVNSYYFVNDFDEVKDLLFYDIDHIKKSNTKLVNSVKVIDINSEIVSDEDYVFLINYNEGVYPVNYKDEDYLNDEVKKSIGISTSYELNTSNCSEIHDVIKSIKNLIVSYHKYESISEVFISSSYDESLFNISEDNISFNHSNIYNINKLVSLMDDYKKYGTVSDDLVLLYNHYNDINYLDYDNKYKNINVELLKTKLNNQLWLSYSSMNTYYECSFKYYLSNILYLNKFEDSFEMTIGNIFHHILSKCFIESIDFDKMWDYEIENSKYSFNNMERYFLGKLKEELLLIIETINSQMNYSSLKKIMCEKEVIINVNDELNIKFKGYVDKILYDEFDGETIVAIIDYKTGNPNTSINNVVYGLDMQLPVYMYLIKNSNILKNVRIGGLYLQKILSTSKDVNERINSLKLQGYSNSDIGVLEKVDSSYNNSSVIKSMKTTSDGFYSYSKVLSDDEFNYLSSLVSRKIDECSKGIINGDFDINPKQIGSVNKSCRYCNYKDICYMKNEDIVELKESKSIFGGDE